MKKTYEQKMIEFEKWLKTCPVSYQYTSLAYEPLTENYNFHFSEYKIESEEEGNYNGQLSYME